jgi:N-acetylneuraminic acid mutarotase
MLGVLFALALPGAFVAAMFRTANNPEGESAVYLPLLRLPGEPLPSTQATATMTASAATAQATATATSTSTTTATSTGEAATAIPSATPTNTQVSEITATPTLTHLPLVTVTPSATNDPTATATHTPTDEPTTTATATATPTTTATATNTATATATSTPKAVNYSITWRQVANYPRVRVVNSEPKNMGNSEGQAVVLNNKLYVFGGYEQSTFRPLCDSYVYDPSVGPKGTWTQIANLPNGRGLTHAAIATDGTYIYILSGYLEGGSNDTTCGSTGQTFGTKIGWQYDPASDTYTRLPDLPLTRAAGSAVVIGRKLHYFGGTVRQGGGSQSDQVGDHYVLDLDNRSAGWATLASLPNPRHHAAAVAYNGKIYAIGGQIGHDGGLEAQTLVHIYDPATDSWSLSAPLPEGRNHMGNATFVLNNQIFIIGGQIGNEESLATVTIYDMATSTWNDATTLMPAPRHSVVGGAINGKIYYSTGQFSTSTWEGTLVPVP